MIKYIYIYIYICTYIKYYSVLHSCLRFDLNLGKINFELIIFEMKFLKFFLYITIIGFDFFILK